MSSKPKIIIVSGTIIDPKQTLYQNLRKIAKLSTLTSLLEKETVANILDESNPHTVFAP